MCTNRHPVPASPETSPAELHDRTLSELELDRRNGLQHWEREVCSNAASAARDDPAPTSLAAMI